MINIPSTFKTAVNPRRPPFIKVIKQRVPPREDTIWYSSDQSKIYSGIFNEKQYIYSFLTLESAKRCFEFLKKYNEVNGHYPDLHGKKYIKDISGKESIYIDDEKLFTLKKKCLINGVGLIGISHFDYTFIDSFFKQKNVFNLSISAVDLLDDISLGKAEQVDHLNYLLDF